MIRLQHIKMERELMLCFRNEADSSEYAHNALTFLRFSITIEINKNVQIGKICHIVEMKQIFRLVK